MSAAILCAMVLHLAAWHPEPGYNSDTPGIGVSCERGAALVAAGSMRNSEGGESRYLVGGLYAGAWGPLRFGGVVGAIDGYRRNHGGVLPVAAGLVAVDLGAGFGARFLIVPPVDKGSAAVHLAITRGF